MNKMDTKSKILKVAQKLFAEKGFDGTSIRDIASEAEANIAAVNYHFKNKQNLYWSVYLNSHTWLSSEIEKLAQKNKSLSDLLWEIFSFMHENSRFLRNAFMIMLSDSFPEVDDEIKTEMLQNKEMGPPGGEFIFKVLSDEVGDQISVEMKRWGVETLFANIVHWALILSGTHCKEIYSDHPMFQMEYRKKCFRHHVTATIAYLKTNQKF